MKTILNVLFVLLVSSTYSTCFAETVEQTSIMRDDITAPTLRIHIDITLTSKDGCKFHIVGDYNTWTGSFNGSVTASGDGDCPNGTWTFGLVIPDDDGEIQLIGENPFIDILKEDSDLLTKLVETIKRQE